MKRALSNLEKLTLRLYLIAGYEHLDNDDKELLNSLPAIPLERPLFRCSVSRSTRLVALRVLSVSETPDGSLAGCLGYENASKIAHSDTYYIHRIDRGGVLASHSVLKRLKNDKVTRLEKEWLLSPGVFKMHLVETIKIDSALQRIELLSTN